MSQIFFIYCIILNNLFDTQNLRPSLKAQKALRVPLCSTLTQLSYQVKQTAAIAINSIILQIVIPLCDSHIGWDSTLSFNMRTCNVHLVIQQFLMSVRHKARSRNDVGLHKKIKGRVIPMETSLSKRKSPRPVRISYYPILYNDENAVCVYICPSSCLYFSLE